MSSPAPSLPVLDVKPEPPSHARPPKRRMLIIVNPYATTVSDRLKSLVVYALQGRYEVEAVSTEAQNHATEIGREAINGGYDIVVAFGGDGTLNEVANGLAGTDIPVSILPGGSTNVVARTLGIPNDVVDATEHLLGCADRFEPRAIDLGIANGRRFVFACGAGLDATAAQQVDSHPRMKHRFGPYYYTWAAIRGLLLPLPARPDPDERRVRRRRAPRASPRSARTPTPSPTSAGPRCASARTSRSTPGRLSLAVLRRAAQRDVPFIAARVLGSRSTAGDHRQIDHFANLSEARIESRLARRGRRPGGLSRSRSTATTSASTASSTWRSTPARCA